MDAPVNGASAEEYQQPEFSDDIHSVTVAENATPASSNGGHRTRKKINKKPDTIISAEAALPSDKHRPPAVRKARRKGRGKSTKPAKTSLSHH
jgi:hypothetical protein